MFEERRMVFGETIIRADRLRPKVTTRMVRRLGFGDTGTKEEISSPSQTSSLAARVIGGAGGGFGGLGGDGGSDYNMIDLGGLDGGGGNGDALVIGVNGGFFGGGGPG